MFGSDLLQVLNIREQHIHEIAQRLAYEFLLPLTLQVHAEVAQDQINTLVGLFMEVEAVIVGKREHDVDCALAEGTGGLLIGFVQLVEALKVDGVEAGLEDDVVLLDLHEVEEQVGVAHLSQIAHLLASGALAADQAHLGLLLFLLLGLWLLGKEELLILLDLLVLHHLLLLQPQQLLAPLGLL